MRPSTIHNPHAPIVIAGAGPAGTSAAIRLANQGFRVILIEREKFPREKLCGEFISPECFRHFAELGVLDGMLETGGDRITETVFYAPNGRFVNVPSKWFNGETPAALGLSRAEMDFRLMARARAAGVEVFEETQVVGLLMEKNSVAGVKVKDKDAKAREIESGLLIDATGRAGILGKLAEKETARLHKNEGQKTKDKGLKTKLVGFKAHLKNVNLEKGRCEIYFFRGGYGGLNYVENGIGNHCFLIQADIVREFNGDAQRIVNEVVFKNKRAQETLKEAVPVYDWLAVSVDGFGEKNLNPAPNLLSIGDAGAFIDPFTGSGMLMAMESAEILTNVIKENLTGPQLAEKYQIFYRQKFRKRLQICKLLRHAAFAPNLAGFIIFMLSFSAKPREILAHATRTSLPINKNN